MLTLLLLLTDAMNERDRERERKRDKLKAVRGEKKSLISSIRTLASSEHGFIRFYTNCVVIKTTGLWNDKMECGYDTPGKEKSDNVRMKCHFMLTPW